MGALVGNGPAGRFGVALVERDEFGQLAGASEWWRYTGDGGRLFGLRWFDSERAAVLAVVSAGFDLSRWAVWYFPAGHGFPECRGAVSDLYVPAATAAAREPVEWVFVNTDTGVAEVADSSAYFVELGRLSDDESDTLNDADSFGAYNEGQCSIVRRVGVPVSELVEAWLLVRSGVRS